MSITDDRTDGVKLRTRIPEGRRVEGLEYGRHWTARGRSGYYVRPEGADRWGYARTTPADDELLDSDSAIVHAIREEL